MVLASSVISLDIVIACWFRNFAYLDPALASKFGEAVLTDQYVLQDFRIPKDHRITV